MLHLCFVWQLISDAGYQGEITSVSTACQQLEVFSRVLRTSLATILDGGEENLEKNLPEFAVSSLLCDSWMKRLVGVLSFKHEKLLPAPALPRPRSNFPARELSSVLCVGPQLCLAVPLQKMVCHGEHTYLFAQAVMSVLAQEEQGGSAVRRVAQEVQRYAQEK